MGAFCKYSAVSILISLMLLSTISLAGEGARNDAIKTFMPAGRDSTIVLEFPKPLNDGNVTNRGLNLIRNSITQTPVKRWIKADYDAAKIAYRDMLRVQREGIIPLPIYIKRHQV